jgi:hypothetical protein
VQLQELNLKELKVVLREIKDIGNRIFANRWSQSNIRLPQNFSAAHSLQTLPFHRQRNGRHRLAAHYDHNTNDLEVLSQGANEELFTDLTVHESKVPYFRVAGQA